MDDVKLKLQEIYPICLELFNEDKTQQINHLNNSPMFKIIKTNDLSPYVQQALYAQTRCISEFNQSYPLSKQKYFLNSMVNIKRFFNELTIFTADATLIIFTLLFKKIIILLISHMKHQILSSGSYDITKHLKQQIDDFDYCISDFIISPNSQFMAIICDFEFQTFIIEVIDLQRKVTLNKKHYVNRGLHQQFCQFSHDSKYLVIHTAYKNLHILDLTQLKQRTLTNIIEAFTIDNQNQVYLFKDNFLQIYQIQKKKFIKIKQSDQYEYSGIRKISSQLFLHYVYHGLCARFEVFLLLYKFKKSVLKFKPCWSDDDCSVLENYVTDTKLHIVEFSYRSVSYSNTQLRNLRNGKLIRIIMNSGFPLRHVIQDNKSFYVTDLVVLKYSIVSTLFWVWEKK